MKTRVYVGIIAALAVVVLPSVAGAVTFLDTLTLINTVLNALIPIAIALALVVFFFGLIRYIFKLGDKEGRDAAIQLMIWGVVAIFVMVSIWGIIRLLQSTFRVQGGEAIVPKAVQLGRGF